MANSPPRPSPSSPEICLTKDPTPTHSPLNLPCENESNMLRAPTHDFAFYEWEYNEDPTKLDVDKKVSVASIEELMSTAMHLSKVAEDSTHHAPRSSPREVSSSPLLPSRSIPIVRGSATYTHVSRIPVFSLRRRARSLEVQRWPNEILTQRKMRAQTHFFPSSSDLPPDTELTPMQHTSDHSYWALKRLFEKFKGRKLNHDKTDTTRHCPSFVSH